MIVSYASQNYTINIPFTDKASIDNAVLCILTLLSLGKDFSYINEGIKQLTAVDMRMQLKKGINGCTFINDSYNLDFDSFVAAGFYCRLRLLKEHLILLYLILQKQGSLIGIFIVSSQTRCSSWA